MADKKEGFQNLFSQKAFVTMLLANLISRFGDAIDSIAYAWMVYTMTGSSLLMGSLLAVNAIPNLIFSPFSGVLADFFPKKTIIIIGHLCRGLLVCITAILYLTQTLQVWHLFILTFLISTFETFSAPAQGALLPHIIKKELIPEATGFSQSSSMTVMLLGLGVAGILIASIGIGGVILVDSITFFVAALIIAFIQIPTDIKAKGSLSLSRWWQDLKEGLLYIKTNKLLLTILFLAMFINFALAPLNVLGAVYVKDVLHAGAEALSFIGVSLLIGMILGGLFVGTAIKSFGTWKIIFLGLMFVGICYALIGVPGLLPLNNASCALTCLFYAFAGFAIQFVNNPVSSWIMSNIERDKLGRVSAVLGALCLCANPLGSALSGIVAEIVPVPLLFIVLGIVIAFIVVPVYLFSQKDIQAENEKKQNEDISMKPVMETESIS